MHWLDVLHVKVVLFGYFSELFLEASGREKLFDLNFFVVTHELVLIACIVLVTRSDFLLRGDPFQLL